MIIGSEIKGDYKVSVDVKKLQNSRNLRRAKNHISAVIHGISDEEMSKWHRSYHNLYKTDEQNWNKIRLMTCAHYGVIHVADIPYENVEEANDYAIKLIDELFYNKS